MRNDWMNGIMGVIVGDALGCPVQFMSRSEIANRAAGPVTGMESGGVYETSAGTWTDDSSLTLAACVSMQELREVNLDDIMERFVDWYRSGKYTPFGEAFDIGNTCSMAIERYERERDPHSCGGISEHAMICAETGRGILRQNKPP